jgi:DNA-binding CsgD family transcriptional regulator
MGERARHRCRERIAALIDADLDAEQARRAAITELRKAIGFARWCWPLTDPDTGLAMSGIGEFDFAASLPRLVALEEQGDVTNKPQLIVGARRSVALSAATRGDLMRSRRWRECLRPYGIGDEVMTACRDRYGCWGSVELMRDSDDRGFHEDDVRLLDTLAPMLGALVRRSLVRDRTGSGFEVDARPPGTIVLDDTFSTIGWTAPVHHWLRDLGDGDMLPPAVYEIGARVLTPPGGAHRLPPSVRVQARSGRWCVIEGARLEGDAVQRVAITIRAATADEIFDLLCKAHGLTGRERQVVSLARGGLATTQLARALGISAYTVQDHLKAIFDKTRVRSRRELMSHLTGKSSVGVTAAIHPSSPQLTPLFR